MRGGAGGFEAVVGQEAAVAALRAILARTGGQGTTLIHGPEGVGRFLLAQCAATAILGDRALVEAGTHPGAGLPGVLSSARVLDQVVPDASKFL